VAAPVLNIRVSVELIRALRPRADQEEISVGDLCRRFLSEGLERPPAADDGKTGW
jgi:hypothetical protein